MTKVKVFTGNRGNGKTRRLMEYAIKNRMAVLTTNKNSLEYNDLNDLADEETRKSIRGNVVVDDCAGFIETILKDFKVCAVSVTDDFPYEKG